MDNKSKCLCVAIAVLLASNGYLLYRLGNAEGKSQPAAGSNEEAKLLASAYKKSIELAKSVDAKSILFPAISAGIYGYPLKEALSIAVNSIEEGCNEHNFFGDIAMVCFDGKTYALLSKLLT